MMDIDGNTPLSNQMNPVFRDIFDPLKPQGSTFEYNFGPSAFKITMAEVSSVIEKVTINDCELGTVRDDAFNDVSIFFRDKALSGHKPQFAKTFLDYQELNKGLQSFVNEELQPNIIYSFFFAST